IILIRHGESQGNVDHQVYATVPDSQLELTAKGRAQAVDAGKRLKKIIGDESLYVYLSPYRRSKETFEGIQESINKQIINIREDPRIREQEWGNFMDPEKRQHELEEREKVGSFFYRFRNGESGADVYDRCTLFLDTIHRQLSSGYYASTGNILIVSHDIFIRLFLMRYFRWTTERHHQTRDLRNCELCVLEVDRVSGSYVLKTELSEKRPSIINYNQLVLDVNLKE
ncbi:unnamed protein product, partial [Didymodactylos carnosus]